MSENVVIVVAAHTPIDASGARVLFLRLNSHG